MQYPDDFLKNNSVQGRGDKRELDKTDSPYLVRFGPDGVTRKKDRFTVFTPSQKTEIEVPNPSYEFFTSEHIDPVTLSTPGAPPVTNELGQTYYPVLGSGVRYRKGVSKAIYSSSISPVIGGPQWFEIPAGQEKFYKTIPPSPYYIPDNPNYFSTWASWQNQKFSEHVWWPNNKSASLVTSTAGIAPGVMNMAGWLHQGAKHQNIRARAHDVGRDIVPAYYDKDGVKAGAPFLPSHIWWRHAAVQTVHSAQYGSRKFFILSDSHGQFHVYPVKKYQNIYTGGNGDHFTSLPASAYKTYMPPYPEWVTLPDLNVENEYGQWFWSFNKDATKAVSIPFKRVPASMWRTFGYEDIGLPFPWSLNPLYMEDNWAGVQSDPEVIATNPNYSQKRRAQEDTPGLVEFNIEIVLSGLGDMDYEANFTLGRSEFFDENNRYFCSAGYLLKKTAIEMGGDAQEDDLVTAEVEAYIQLGPNFIEAVKIGGAGVGGAGSYIVNVAAESRIARFGIDAVWPQGNGGTMNNGPYGHIDDRSGLRTIFVDDVERRAAAYSPGFSDMDAANYGISNNSSNQSERMQFDGYFTVKNYNSSNVLRRIPIMNKSAWSASGSAPGEPVYSPGFHIVGVDPRIAPIVRTVLSAFDLRSMSFMLIDSVEKVDTGGLGDGFTIVNSRLITFNKERESAAIHQIGGGAIIDGVGPTPIPFISDEIRSGYTNLVTTVNPADLDCALLLLQSLALYAMTTQFTHSISVHPNGSWACGSTIYGDINGKLDIIAPAGAAQTSHRAVFNKAFGQDRSYSFYGDATAGGDGDVGSFCTTGIWKPF